MVPRISPEFYGAVCRSLLIEPRLCDDCLTLATRKIRFNQDYSDATILISARHIGNRILAAVAEVISQGERYFITIWKSIPLAGAPGFEPGNADTKNRCLTAWRRPNEEPYLHKPIAGCNTEKSVYAFSAKNPQKGRTSDSFVRISLQFFRFALIIYR